MLMTSKRDGSARTVLYVDLLLSEDCLRNLGSMEGVSCSWESSASPTSHNT